MEITPDTLTLVLSGVVLGLAAGLAPGPLLALVIAQTLRYGAAEGIKIATAPIVTDLPIVAFSLLLLARLSSVDMALGVVATVGAGVLAYLCYESLQIAPPAIDVRSARPRSFSQGALVNVLNPHPYLFWLTIGAPTVYEAWADGAMAAVGFVTAFYVCLVGSKILLALLVGRGRGVLAGRPYVWVRRVLALALLLFAASYLRDATRYFGLV